MLVSGEWFKEINIDNFEIIETMIRPITVKNRSYIGISDTNGDYIQIGGYADRVNAEVRIYEAAEKFKHYKADTSSNETPGFEIISIGGASVKVSPTQVLTLETAINLVKSFYKGNKLSETVYWNDMTEMFA